MTTATKLGIPPNLVSDFKKIKVPKQKNQKENNYIVVKKKKVFFALFSSFLGQLVYKLINILPLLFNISTVHQRKRFDSERIKKENNYVVVKKKEKPLFCHLFQVIYTFLIRYISTKYTVILKKVINPPPLTNITYPK